MKNMKKLFAAVLAMVMVFAMNVTAFADPTDSSVLTAKSATITVTNFTSREGVKVELYKMITLDAANSQWDVADWAKDGVTWDGSTAKYDFSKINYGSVKNNDETTANGGNVTFTVTEPGAYLIIATGTKTKYAPMVAACYKYDNNNLMVVADATVVAKGENIIVDKDAGDRFVHAGQDVTFTVTATMPYFAEDDENKTFKVYDQPFNLTDLTLTKATIGNENANVTMIQDGDKYVVDFSSYADQTGATIVVEYTAKVSGDQGYINTTWSQKNGTDGSSTTVTGFTGDITLTKYASDSDNNDLTNNKKLSGAQFKVSKNNKWLTFDEDNKFAGYVDKEEDATVITVGADGTVKVTGVDEGTYYFKEIKAPVGYSVNDKDAVAIVEASNEAHKSAYAHMIDTTLLALPATGGIGTTIFTVAGVAIMVVAAALFFATRRKNTAK